MCAVLRSAAQPSKVMPCLPKGSSWLEPPPLSFPRRAARPARPRLGPGPVASPGRRGRQSTRWQAPAAAPAPALPLRRCGTSRTHAARLRARRARWRGRGGARWQAPASGVRRPARPRQCRAVALRGAGRAAVASPRQRWQRRGAALPAAAWWQTPARRAPRWSALVGVRVGAARPGGNPRPGPALVH